MIRTTTLATVAGFALGASLVLAVQAGRRHRTKSASSAARGAKRSPTLVLTGQHEAPAPAQPVPTIEPVPPVAPVEVVPVADVPPTRNGDRPPTPNLDRILAQRAAEQRDEPD